MPFTSGEMAHHDQHYGGQSSRMQHGSEICFHTEGLCRSLSPCPGGATGALAGRAHAALSGMPEPAGYPASWSSSNCSLSQRQFSDKPHVRDRWLARKIPIRALLVISHQERVPSTYVTLGVVLRSTNDAFHGPFPNH